LTFPVKEIRENHLYYFPADLGQEKIRASCLQGVEQGRPPCSAESGGFLYAINADGWRLCRAWRRVKRGSKEEESMVKKLYIGNLAEGVTEDDLMANFSEIGKVVSLAIIRDKITGLSRGFGFVEMATEAQAQEAIQTFNGGELLGRTIRVDEAKPKGDQDERPRGTGSRHGGFSSQAPRRGGGPRRSGGGGREGRQF